MSDQLQHFDNTHNEAFRKLGAQKPGRHWSAFDVPLKQARQGKAKFLLITIWNYRRIPHWSGRGIPTREPAIRQDYDGTLWYRAEKPTSGPEQNLRAAHWKKLEIAKEQGLEIIGVLKDAKTELCSLTHLFDCDPPREQKSDGSMWLQLHPRNDIRCDASPGNIQQMIDGESVTLPEEIEQPKKYIEGATTIKSVNAYERNGEARDACIKHHGTTCAVCGFNFKVVYGEIGAGFIHVHHLRPLSDIKEQYELDPIEDLIPVCPNCHAIIHRAQPDLTIEQLKGHMKGA